MLFMLESPRTCCTNLFLCDSSPWACSQALMSTVTGKCVRTDGETPNSPMRTGAAPVISCWPASIARISPGRCPEVEKPGLVNGGSTTPAVVQQVRVSWWLIMF